MIQTGEGRSCSHYRIENYVKWHFEHKDTCTPLCRVMNGRPGAPHHPARYMTDKWEYVTCEKCLKFKPKEESK